MDETKTEKNKKIPNHIAVIPDGNRRWAREKGLPTLEGHRRGAENFEHLLNTARDAGIKVYTSWAFSTENWNRSDEENTYLFNLARDFSKKYKKKFLAEKVRFIHMGRKDRLPKDLIDQLNEMQEETKEFTDFTAVIGMDYGGHDEILRAVTKIIEDIQAGKISKDDIWKEIGEYQGKYPYYLFNNYLDTKDLEFPYPDLVIRTSGEKRTSGLLPWQAAYAEFYFAPEYFPDFGPEQLKKAINDFGKRDRRFGGDSK